MTVLRTRAIAAVAYIDQFGLDPHEAAGLVRLATARSTGTLVGVYRANDAGLEDRGWASVCETHSRLVIHDTRKLAEYHASCPEGWCGICNGSETS